MEWRGNFHLGKAIVVIDFTGGTFSGMGQTPATFTTSDPALQKIIEESGHFRSGRVKRILSIFDRLEEASTKNRTKTAQKPHIYQAADANDAADWLEQQAGLPTDGITDSAGLTELAARNGITLLIEKTEKNEMQ